MIRSALQQRFALGVAALLVWAPGAAEACSVCSAAGDERTRAAFLITTVMLSILPFGLVGGVIWWLLRRSREIERERASARSPDWAGSPVSRASSSP